jgi:hypothetical protein
MRSVIGGLATFAHLQFVCSLPAAPDESLLEPLYEQKVDPYRAVLEQKCGVAKRLRDDHHDADRPAGMGSVGGAFNAEVRKTSIQAFVANSNRQFFKSYFTAIRLRAKSKSKKTEF